jgi:hypothetical protein
MKMRMQRTYFRRGLVQLQPFDTLKYLGQTIPKQCGLDVDFGTCWKPFVADKAANLQNDMRVLG